MKLFTGVSHFFYILLIFHSVGGGVCHEYGGDVVGAHGVFVDDIVARKPNEILPDCSLVPLDLGARPLRNFLFSCDLVGLRVDPEHPLFGPEHLLVDPCGLRCDLAVHLDVERLSNLLFDLSHLPYDP